MHLAVIVCRYGGMRQVGVSSNLLKAELRPTSGNESEASYSRIWSTLRNLKNPRHVISEFLAFYRVFVRVFREITCLMFLTI